ncbi:MAG TPA: hypothetical protein VF148_08600 [Acidimicrobiia bacterium]
MTFGPYRLQIATDFGPRITSLRWDRCPELLAQLGPEVNIEHDGGVYPFRGGHRLWASPEVPAVTYASDDHECAVAEAGGLVTVSAPADPAGLVKEITVSLDGESLLVDHKITKADGDTASLAAWAITQFPLGGTAILPLIGEDTAPSANRYLVIWPYTSIEDRRVTFCDDALELEAKSGHPLKFGVGPAPGRLGYFLDGVVFIKEIEPATGRIVPDHGAVGQVYIGEHFCELESVGGITDLSRGRDAVLRERWTVVDCGDLDSATRLTVEP